MLNRQTTVEVLSPGTSTTIQDTGRPGHLAQGIPPSGAQDFESLSIANRLVGNPVGQPPLTLGDPGAAGLEVMLSGPRLRFPDGALVAVTGGEFPVKLDGRKVSRWESLWVPAGSVLEIGVARRGIRCYVAISGGIDGDVWLGSRATHVRGGQGGMDGRILRKGDRLKLGTCPDRAKDMAGTYVPESAIPSFENPHEVRVILGPQDYLFTDEGVERFLTLGWKLSPVSDRMGFRVDGGELPLRDRAEYLVREAGKLPTNIVLDVTPIGAIQITSGTEAIIMGVEAPSIGGYAKIATVISADYGRLGQIRPGEELRFSEVSLEKALKIAADQWKFVSNVEFGTADE